MFHRSTDADAGLATGWIIGIVVVAVLAVGGGVWAYTASDGGSATPEAAPTSPKPTEPAEAPETEEPEPEPETSDVAEMLAGVKAGNELMCTGVVEGNDFTMYIQDFDLFRMDSSAPEAGDFHLLRLGDQIHVWYPKMNTGITWPAGDATPEGTPDDFSKLTVDDLNTFGDGTEMTCDKYVGDLAVFELPTDINFMSIQELTAPAVR